MSRFDSNKVDMLHPLCESKVGEAYTALFAVNSAYDFKLENIILEGDSLPVVPLSNTIISPQIGRYSL
jgi:hypothetical protein